MGEGVGKVIFRLRALHNHIRVSLTIFAMGHTKQEFMFTIQACNIYQLQ